MEHDLQKVLLSKLVGLARALNTVHKLLTQREVVHALSYMQPTLGLAEYSLNSRARKKALQVYNTANALQTQLLELRCELIRTDQHPVDN